MGGRFRAIDFASHSCDTLLPKCHTRPVTLASHVAYRRSPLADKGRRNLRMAKMRLESGQRRIGDYGPSMQIKSLLVAAGLALATALAGCSTDGVTGVSFANDYGARPTPDTGFRRSRSPRSPRNTAARRSATRPMKSRARSSSIPARSTSITSSAGRQGRCATASASAAKVSSGRARRDRRQARMAGMDAAAGDDPGASPNWPNGAAACRAARRTRSARARSTCTTRAAIPATGCTARPNGGRSARRCRRAASA